MLRNSYKYLSQIAKRSHYGEHDERGFSSHTTIRLLAIFATIVAFIATMGWASASPAPQTQTRAAERTVSAANEAYTTSIATLASRAHTTALAEQAKAHEYAAHLAKIETEAANAAKIQAETERDAANLRALAAQQEAETAKKAKAARDAAKAQAAKAAPAPSSNAPAVAGGSDWDRLAQCESGGNWAINSGNGYYGGIQFSLSSWRGVGGTGYPHEHSREEQIKRGEMLRAQGGWRHWPACSKKLGLR